MSYDLSHVLRRWEFRPGEAQVRRIKGRDGRAKIQLRVDLGILQLEAEGRPDGKRPMGHESWLDAYRARRDRRRGQEGAAAFVLRSEDCQRLHQEWLQYDHRYICLFQLGDHAGVLRDTERNLAALQFLEGHAESPEAGAALGVFVPQLLLLRTRAQGALAIEADDPRRAVELIEQGIEGIRQWFRRIQQEEAADQSAEVQLLEAWLRVLRPRVPLTRREELEQQLKAALGREDYERAAQVRDELRRLEG